MSIFRSKRGEKPDDVVFEQLLSHIPPKFFNRSNFNPFEYVNKFFIVLKFSMNIHLLISTIFIISLLFCRYYSHNSTIHRYYENEEELSKVQETVNNAVDIVVNKCYRAFNNATTSFRSVLQTFSESQAAIQQTLTRCPARTTGIIY